jgi:hypothetical protein
VLTSPDDRAEHENDAEPAHAPDPFRRASPRLHGPVMGGVGRQKAEHPPIVRTRRPLDILGAIVFGTILLAMIVLAVLIPWLSIQTGFLAFVAIVGISAALTLFFLAKVAGRPTLENASRALACFKTPRVFQYF